MKIAILYYSKHHGNTLKVLKEAAEDRPIDFIDVTARDVIHLEEYDLIGIASGIYYGKFSSAVLVFLQQYLPDNKPVFLFYTCGFMKKGYTNSLIQVLANKHSQVIGTFGCLGYDTFGPFKIIGGISKNHPDEKDVNDAKVFLMDTLLKVPTNKTSTIESK